MVKRILVNVICSNMKTGKTIQDEFVVSDRVEAARILMSYKPKRNHDVVQVTMHFVEGLV